MQNLISQLQNLQGIIKITLSDTSTYQYKKIIIRPIIIKGQSLWQIEQYTENKVFHTNVNEKQMSEFFCEICAHFGQITFYYADRTVIFSRKGNSYHAKTTQNTIPTRDIAHDKTKNYILPEGSDIPAFVDLGIFGKDNRIIKAKFDKFKQINRFIEVVDDALKTENSEEFVVLDFGCGKSYLTFILYYYLTEVKHIKTQIIGYDLKADVVEHCNQIAKKYGYDNLHFYVNDVSKGTPYSGKIDMVVTLHACDTATDFAMEYAIKNDVKYIFSVPCCQHEINSQIASNGDYDILLKHGLIKERFCALLTDSIRAEILHQYGYGVDLIEFVDFSNSPKNILFRARKTAASRKANFDIGGLCRRYNFTQKLYGLTKQ